MVSPEQIAVISFQFTRPQEARHHHTVARPCRRVSIHAPARGATCRSTRSDGICEVSIHAPARGATNLENARSSKPNVSIHAPARGATRADEARQSPRSFQFTRPQEARQAPRPEGFPARHVSIHAPARGATRAEQTGGNPKTFQFTRPQEARHRRTTPPLLFHRFNSRARKRRDMSPTAIPTAPAVSIHAPARGATITAGVSVPTHQFQFTRPQEARPVAPRLPDRRREVSIHAPARGATSPSVLCLMNLVCFNSRARKRRDLL